MPTLSDDDITAIRRRYIRDVYTPAVPGVSAAEAMSHFNIARKAQFIKDEDLQAKADDVVRAYREELAGVYTDQYQKQIAGHASAATADTEATLLQKDALYRLIRAAVFEDMMNDPGFQGSIADEQQRASLFKVWEKQIGKDRMFTRARTTSALRAIPIEYG